MNEEARALALEVTDAGAHVELQLLAHSSRSQEVSYEIEVTGDSTTRHKGRTTLQAGAEAVLSTIRTSKSGDWCARVTVREEGREAYQILRGSCA